MLSFVGVIVNVIFTLAIERDLLAIDFTGTTLRPKPSKSNFLYTDAASITICHPIALKVLLQIRKPICSHKLPLVSVIIKK